MKKYKLLICFIISFIGITIISKNSFLYSFNDWVDVDSYMTVARGWINGLIPYRDLFEQKGPLLYLIYVIANILSYKSFTGVYILEVISFTIFLYYIYKIINKYISDKYSIISLILFSTLIITSKSFYFGGSAEEFTLPLISVIFYYFTNFIDREEVSFKELFIAGLVTGLIFDIKFNLIGFSFIYMAYIDIYYLIKKDISKCIKYSLVFLLGMFIPILIFVIYFLINNSLSYFIEAYITYNSTTYNFSISILKRLYYIIYFSLHGLYTNYYIIPFYLIGVIGVIFSNKLYKNITKKIGLILFIAFPLIFIYFNARSYPYYFLPMEMFMIYGFIFIFKLIDKYMNKKRLNIILVSIIVISSLLLVTSKNIKFIKITKDELVQYKYANIIPKDSKVLFYDNLDAGFYFSCDIIPSNRYFHKLNGISDEMYEDVLSSINNMEYDYIIYDNTSGIEKNIGGYRVISADISYNDTTKHYYYLYEKYE